MKINIKIINGISIAEILSNTVIINEIQDALDLMANSQYQGAHKIIVQEHQIAPAFFDLKTGMAGDILQKFSNYGVQLAVVGDFSKYTSKSLRDFIFESNNYGRVNFVQTFEEAVERLVKK